MLEPGFVIEPVPLLVQLTPAAFAKEPLILIVPKLFSHRITSAPALTRGLGLNATFTVSVTGTQFPVEANTKITSP